MLEKVDLTNALPKDEFKERMPKLQERLRVLQQAVFDAGVAVTVVLEGWDAAGKGSLVQRLLEKLDPRGFKVRPTYAASPEELYRPWLWRFWQRQPAYGEIAVFDRSWYGRTLVERVEGVVDDDEIARAIPEINEFERMMVDDGQVLVKLLLHISKKEQRRRFRKCEKDPYQRWKVKPEDWRHHKQYGGYVDAIEETLEKTSTTHAPWTIVEAEDRRWSVVKSFTTIIDAIESRLKKLGKCPAPDAASAILQPKALPPEAQTKIVSRAGNGSKRRAAARVAAKD